MEQSGQSALQMCMAGLLAKNSAQQTLQTCRMQPFQMRVSSLLLAWGWYHALQMPTYSRWCALPLDAHSGLFPMMSSHGVTNSVIQIDDV